MAIFTAKSVDSIPKTHGTQSWVLDRLHAKRCRYAVLCRNAHTDWGDGKERHGTAFRVDRIEDVVRSTDTPGRWLVTCDEYALIDQPGAWKGWRNPIRYTAPEELGIDLSELSFKPVPKSESG
jgi:hypothetical protein